jgi:hypothetical protein
MNTMQNGPRGCDLPEVKDMQPYTPCNRSALLKVTGLRKRITRRKRLECGNVLVPARDTLGDRLYAEVNPGFFKGKRSTLLRS